MLYGSSQRRYLHFCGEANLTPLPASEKVLCYFAAFLAKEKLKHKTIKVYLSGVELLHISEGFSDLFQQPMNQLHYVLWGIKRCELEEGGGNRVRLPISPSLLRKIKGVWNRSDNRDFLMLWAACCLVFWEWGRWSPHLTQNLTRGLILVRGANLSEGNLAVDQVGAPTIIQVSIKQS